MPADRAAAVAAEGGVPTGHEPSYYAATARGIVDRPRLEGAVDADVCVIGGGFTGVSAALHLAERGYAVALLEAERIGWGASGRNGGQMGSGQRQDPAALLAGFGRERARELWQLGEAAKSLVRDLIARHGIDCDLKRGQLIAAAKPAHARELEASPALLAEAFGYPHTRYVPPAELRTLLDSPVFHGALLDRDAGHLHPLNFVLGLARAAETAGAMLFERSPASSWTGGERLSVETPAGRVRARHLLFACNGYLGSLEPRLAGWIMPINNFVVATAPLGDDRARELIRDDVCVHDTRFVVNYFRLSEDRRLIFGGGENYGASFPRDIAAFVRPYMLRVFPQLADVPVEYAWGGTLAISMSRLPHVGRLAPDVYFAHGFSGHGISTGTLAGALVAEAIAGTAERFDLFASLPARRFPGGRWLRQPGLVLGMLYYALRDRL